MDDGLVLSTQVNLPTYYTTYLGSGKYVRVLTKKYSGILFIYFRFSSIPEKQTTGDWDGGVSRSRSYHGGGFISFLIVITYFIIIYRTGRKEAN